MVAIHFRYLTGLRSTLFTNARVRGSWDGAGNYSDVWSDRVMLPIVAEDGCPAFQLTVELAAAGIGNTFHRGVVVDGPFGANSWGIPTELAQANNSDRYRDFLLAEGGSTEDYYFTFARRCPRAWPIW